MTGRTHDLAAFTSLVLLMAYVDIPPMTLATAALAFGSNMIGGLLPDIDNGTADIWDKIRGGSLLAKIIKPLIGHHRMISHSILGMAIAGWVIGRVLEIIHTVLLVDMNIVWWALMAGYASHLVMDSLTTEGVPWLFPLPVRFGFPPYREFRVKTGNWIEKFMVVPLLMLLNGYLLYSHYPVFISFFKSFK